MTLFLVLLAGCPGPANTPDPAEPDRPVPDAEPRDQLVLSLDLAPASDCEERFDLALYRDRSVDLVSWDDRVGACRGRVASIRYLSRKTTKEALLGKVAQLAARAELCTSETCSP